MNLITERDTQHANVQTQLKLTVKRVAHIGWALFRFIESIPALRNDKIGLQHLDMGAYFHMGAYTQESLVRR